jgi:NIMA-interacting peptidyl-prolyl cis-trans isomerase 1
VRHSNSKNLPYYFNAATKESRWEPPSGTDSEKLKVYMALHHSASTFGADGNGVNEGKIRAAHLLVKHKESRRPKSWKEVGVTESLRFYGKIWILLDTSIEMRLLVGSD